MEIAWHGNYFRYFEAARIKLLRKIDYDYSQMKASHYLWPLVDARVRFVKPVRYGQTIRVEAGLVEWENRMKIKYRISDVDTGERLTTGYTIQCAIDANTWTLQMVSPPALLDRLRAYL